MAVEAIRVEGLRELRRSLKRLDGDLPKALRVGLNQGAQIIVDDARPKIPRRSGRMAASLTTASTGDKVRVKGGGRKAPHFPWRDFGGRRVGRGGGVAELPFLKKGRYVWASFADRRDDLLTKVDDAVADVARQAGLEVVTTRGQ